MTATRSPERNRLESPASTTTPAASCPIALCSVPLRRCLNSVHIGATRIFTTTRSPLALGSGRSSTSMRPGPVMAAARTRALLSFTPRPRGRSAKVYRQLPFVNEAGPDGAANIPARRSLRERCGAIYLCRRPASSPVEPYQHTEGVDLVHKHVKRGFVPLLGAVVALALTACGASGSSSASNTARGPVPDPKKPVTITFASWVGSDATMLALRKEFQKEHPNITVKFENIPSDSMTQKLTTQIAGGNPPDAAFVDASSVASFSTR